MGSSTAAVVAVLASLFAVGSGAVLCVGLAAASSRARATTPSAPGPAPVSSASASAPAPASASASASASAPASSASAPGPPHAPGVGVGRVVRTTATYHPDFSTNACGLKPDPSGMNTAMSPALATALGVPVVDWGSATCGRKLRVTNAALTNAPQVVVTVLDQRAGNDHGLDLQQPAFAALDGNGAGVAAGQLADLTVQFVT